MQSDIRTVIKFNLLRYFMEKVNDYNTMSEMILYLSVTNGMLTLHDGNQIIWSMDCVLPIWDIKTEICIVLNDVINYRFNYRFLFPPTGNTVSVSCERFYILRKHNTYAEYNYIDNSFIINILSFV
jgi:hypothetical protein